jgi:RNA polymerase sigma factor (sigma-70 family)
MEQAVEAMVVAYRPLVYVEARRYMRFLPYDDLCSYGMIGLVQAAKAYDPDATTYAFASIAKRRIRGSIVEGLRSEFGRTGKKAKFTKYAHPLDASMEDDERMGTPSKVTENEALASLTEGYIQELLDELPAMDRTVIDLRYGAGWNAKQIAKLFGISETKVAIIIQRSLARLREILEARGFTSSAEVYS